jgi:DNA polymerase-3 subunit delta'
MPAPNPRANPLLLGHDAAERTLLDAIRQGRVHHAWLITGPDGIGKATLAFRFAKRLLAGEGAGAGEGLALDPAHPVFRRVASGGHADLLVVERAYDEKTKRRKRDIATDDVREINGFMALTPAEGGWRVVIVDGAESLNQNSANALLKILEEPPSRAVLILVCSSPGRLPATIRSRCRSLRLAPLTDDVMARLLAAYSLERTQDDRDRLALLADGSIGRALHLSDEGGIEIASLVDQLFAALPDVPLSRGHAIADTLGRDDASFALFTDQLISGVQALVRDSVRGRADPEQLRLADLRPLEAWGEVWQGLLRLQDETERFALDKRQAYVSCVEMLTGRMS